jgi:hypothetical protein
MRKIVASVADGNNLSAASEILIPFDNPDSGNLMFLPETPTPLTTPVPTTTGLKPVITVRSTSDSGNTTSTSPLVSRLLLSISTGCCG